MIKADRERIEQALARGERPSYIARTLGVTYAEIRDAERHINDVHHERPQRARCGTVEGYRQHRRKHQAACFACKQAADAARPALAPCGTEAAYTRHRRAGNEPCAECRDAHIAYGRQRRGARRSA